MSPKAYHQPLVDFARKKDFFVGVDSDGCVFDSMELKQKECFCPAFIHWFDLQGVGAVARETWEYVNLYSRSRGLNRYLALRRALDILATKAQVTERGVKIPAMEGLRSWIRDAPSLDLAGLKARLEETGDPDLSVVWNWSSDVNRTVEKNVRGLGPLPGARKALEEIARRADIMVVSQTPGADLHREWKEHGIHTYSGLIAGQEFGTKAEHLTYGAVGKYDRQKILMIGDAPGDLEAAKLNGVSFFPILPGQENESWVRLLDQGLEKFFSGTFAGEYETGLIKKFDELLP